VTEDKSITELEEIVAALPVVEQERFHRIFHVSTTTGTLNPPGSMNSWIIKHFGSVEAVRHQRIVKVTNLITWEGALFNELRASRPMETKGTADLREVIEQSLGDPFCKPLEGTPADSFGRVQGTHCVTASNIAKYDGFHGVVVSDEHDPLVFTPEGVADYIDTALAWGYKAHEVDPQARYFFFMWNCLWKSGASIIHGHAQMALSRDLHYPKVEGLRRAALAYRAEHGLSYFDDLYAIHQALGLAFVQGRVRGFAYLTPIKEKETMLLADTLDDLKRPIYRILHNFIHTLGVTSFNLALYMPPLSSVGQVSNLPDWNGFPLLVRIVDRGDPNSRTADIGAMELYAASVIASDPFRVAEVLRS
jgi:hypothetical protein